MASYIQFIIFSFLFLSYALLLLPCPSCASDPSPLQDFCVADLNSPFIINGYPCKDPSEVISADFFYNGFKQPPNGFDSLGVNITEATAAEFPGLNTFGLSMNRVTLLPGGLNPPHIHRSSELSLVTEGRIYVGFVSTKYILYSKLLSAGELFVIPPALVHFQLNVGKGNAQFYPSFSSQNPGVERVGYALFNTTPPIPDEVLSKALHTDDNIIEIIKAGISSLGMAPSCSVL